MASLAADSPPAEEGGSTTTEMVYEYAVDMVCDKCAERVHKALDRTDGVSSVTTNVDAQIVVVEGRARPDQIMGRMESAGRKVKLIGSGCSTAVEKGVFVVPAAVGRTGENSAGVLPLSRCPAYAVQTS